MILCNLGWHRWKPVWRWHYGGGPTRLPTGLILQAIAGWEHKPDVCTHCGTRKT